MKNVLLQQAIKLTKQYRRRKHWQQFVRITAAAVVFVTTYALVLPAITMEKETLCGQQEHTHTEECYTDKTVWLMHCTLKADKDIVVLHTHQDHCYTAEGALICQIVERTGHTHDDSCYGAPECVCQIPEGEGHTHSESCTTGKVLTCQIPESSGHTRDDSCAVTEQVLICGTQETPGHTHSESCITTVTEMTCTEAHEHTEQCSVVKEVPCALQETGGHTHGEGCYETRTVPCAREESQGHSHTEACYGTGTVECKIPETPAHTHGESCYGQRGPLVCELEERKPHTHDERCYDSKGNMTCTLPVTVAHTHDETCVTDTGKKVSVLTCDKPVHLHSDDCFAVEEDSRLVFLCNAGTHSHGESCYNGENVLTCTIPEHTHEAACVVADLDLTADVETPDQWEAPLKELYRTGRWPEDLLAVAKTQLEYQESVRNCVLTEMQLKGYTRYGAWYGTPYGDWNTLFVSFCLDYARVEDFPVHEDRVRWMELLEEEELLRIPADYTPKPGDLVFVDKDQVADAPVEIPVIADLVGIVEEILPATEEEPIRLKFIAGDVNNKVDYVTCPLEDITIVGYAELPPEAEKESEEIQDVRQLTYEGEDYTVTVTFTAEAQLPENVQLDVREILAGTEEYDQYYQQSVAMIQGDSQPEAVAEEESTDSDLPQETESVIEELTEKIIEQEPEETPEEASEEEQKPEVTFARFFDIHFVSEGTVLEPAAPVDIHIQYHQGIVQQDQRKGVAVHFAETGAEILNAETVWNQNSQVESFSFTQNSFSVSGTVLVAEPRAAGDVKVYLDGTCGGLNAYNYVNSNNSKIEVTVAKNSSYTLPETFTSPGTYSYRLNGWYDIATGDHYDPGEPVTITQPTVFYADWVAATYNIGIASKEIEDDLVITADTSEFVTVDVFDYNTLFNRYSTSPNVTISNNSHSADWSFVESGSETSSSVTFNGNNNQSENWSFTGEESLGFVFVDSNAEPTSGKMPNPRNRNAQNTYKSGYGVKTGIMPDNLNDPTEDLRLINALFDKKQEVIGRHYLGTGNYLFQYETNVQSKYYGYYYYNSEQNAASFNQSEQRFYVYKYLEHASSSNSKDFLPLNSPYANNPGKKTPQIDTDGGVHYRTSVDGNYTTDNFFFGMKTNIHFYLPNDVGVPVDNHGNPGNLDTNGKPMVFEFSGDDDVWIYVDNMLVLDIGGIHQMDDGSIDFSTGKIVKPDGSEGNLKDIFKDGLKEGGHNLTIYYLERGAGESNCHIYFNLAPRYDLTLKKQDYHTRENLSGVEFGVFTKESCGTGDAAKLWPTHAAAKDDPHSLNTQHIFTTDTNGNIKFFGLVAGKTYYIKELKPAAGYVTTDDLIRITLNNRGANVSEVTMMVGENGNRTQGYELVSHHLNDATQEISLVLTNPKISDSAENAKNIRVLKHWLLSDENPAVIPESITVYLEKDNEQYGHSMTLGPHNGWSYTWTGLPNDGDYRVLEKPVQGFEPYDPPTTFRSLARAQDYTINWLQVGTLEDNFSYRLKINNGYLNLNNGKLQILTIDDGEDLPETVVWDSVAAEEGFRLSCGEYALTLDEGKFVVKPIGEGNQILYYDGDGVFAMQDGKLSYLAVSAGAITGSDTPFEVDLFKQEKIPVDIQTFELFNKQLDTEKTTFLKVNKNWNTEAAVWNRQVTMHLLRNDQNTGLAIVLDNNSKWEGIFEGLPIMDSAGQPYRYSVMEAMVDGYIAEYSEVTTVPEETKQEWQKVSTMAEGQKYIIVGDGNTALTVKKSGTYVSVGRATRNDSDTNQQWYLVDGNKLQSVSNSNYYLRRSSNTLLLTGEINDASPVSLNQNSKLLVNNRYLKLKSNESATDSNERNGTVVSVYQMNTVSTPAGYEVTVTNSPYIFYELPKTGGIGAGSYYTLGTLLAVTVVLVYICINERRRQRGGR